MTTFLVSWFFLQLAPAHATRKARCASLVSPEARQNQARATQSRSVHQAYVVSWVSDELTFESRNLFKLNLNHRSSSLVIDTSVDNWGRSGPVRTILRIYQIRSMGPSPLPPLEFETEEHVAWRPFGESKINSGLTHEELSERYPIESYHLEHLEQIWLGYAKKLNVEARKPAARYAVIKEKGTVSTLQLGLQIKCEDRRWYTQGRVLTLRGPQITCLVPVAEFTRTIREL